MALTKVFNGEGNGIPLQYSCLENPWTEEPGRLQSMGSLRVGTTERLHFHISLSCIGGGHGNLYYLQKILKDVIYYCIRTGIIVGSLKQRFKFPC